MPKYPIFATIAGKFEVAWVTWTKTTIKMAKPLNASRA